MCFCKTPDVFWQNWEKCWNTPLSAPCNHRTLNYKICFTNFEPLTATLVYFTGIVSVYYSTHPGDVPWTVINKTTIIL